MTVVPVEAVEGLAGWLAERFAGRYGYADSTWWMRSGRAWYVCDRQMVLTAVRYELADVYNDVLQDARYSCRDVEKLLSRQYAEVVAAQLSHRLSVG